MSDGEAADYFRRLHRMIMRGIVVCGAKKKVNKLTGSMALLR